MKRDFSSSVTTTKKILKYLAKRRPLLLISLLCAAAITVLTLYIPIVVGHAIDTMVEAGKVDFSRLTYHLITIAVCAAVIGLLQWLMSTVNNKITYETVHDLRIEAFAKIQNLPLSYLDHHPAGEIVSRMITDADQFAEGLLMGFSHFFTGVLTIIGTLIYMLAIHPLTTLVVVILTPLSLLIAQFIAKRTFAMFRLQSKTRGEQTALIEEMIGGQKLIHSFSMEDQTLEKFDRINESLKKASERAIFYSSITNPSTRFVHHMILDVICLTGPLAVISGGMTVGGFTSFISYAGQYGKPFNEISGVIAEIQNALACAGRILDLIDEAPQSSDKNAEILPSPRGHVCFEHVTFSYDPEKPLLRDLNIDVKPGQHVAIVGATGSGKTTIFNLLLRFYDINGGRILIDGKDIHSVTRHSLRDGMGMVLQDTWLRHGTIRENLSFGKPDATDEEIVKAAIACHAHSFIMRLPNGYQTVISEDGKELSAGQRQLLCITRAMLSDPEILILDEATSSIDTRTEAKIQHAFSLLMKDRTTFIAAHRLSTIMEADTILVMDKGNVVEQGTHEQLLAMGGFYTTLYNSQFEH